MRHGGHIFSLFSPVKIKIPLNSIKSNRYICYYADYAIAVLMRTSVLINRRTRVTGSVRGSFFWNISYFTQVVLI